MTRRLPHLILVLLLLFGLSVAKAQQEGHDALDEGALRQLVAPIALYPDSLLSTVLIASTYPLEVVEAARWRRQHPDLDGADAVEAVSDRDWDDSVRTLVAFPDVLERMSEDLEWTARLGDAVLFQEDALMDAVQDLRHRADASGSLEQMEHVRVEREREVIVLHPRYTEVVYVPYYSPRVVYGGWWWPAYQPVYWYPPRGHFGRTGFYWTGSYFISAGFFYSSLDWGSRHVVVVNIHRPPARFIAGRPYLRKGGYEHWRYHRGDRRRHASHRHGYRQRSGSSMRGSQIERVVPPGAQRRGRADGRRGQGESWVYGSRQQPRQRHRSGSRVEAPPRSGLQGTVRRQGSSLRDNPDRPSRHTGSASAQRDRSDMRRSSPDSRRGGDRARSISRDSRRGPDAGRAPSRGFMDGGGNRGSQRQWSGGGSRRGGDGRRGGGRPPVGVESRGRGSSGFQGRGQRSGGGWRDR